MDFEQLIRRRQSCRDFDPNKKISQEDIDKIIEAGLLAPSAKNSQSWRFFVSNDNDAKKAIAKACQEMGANKYVDNAPLLVTVVKERPTVIDALAEKVKLQDFRNFNIGCCSMQMCLQAMNLGIDSLMVGWFNEKKIQAELGLQSKDEVCIVLAFGYAKGGYPVREKTRLPRDKKVKIIE